MFKSYLKVGIRNLLRHKSYSLINIAGLAAGITCCLFIVLYIADELSFDRFHDKADRIHRVVAGNRAQMPPALSPAMKASYPHLVEEVVRLWPLFAPAKLRHSDAVFVESGGAFADEGVFSVFSWPILSGNPSTALRATNSIVMTETMAMKYFGTNDPMGKQVEFWGNQMTVTGIMADMPANSHIRFDFLISFPTLERVMGSDINQNWGIPAFYTYALRREGVTAGDVRGAVRQLFDLHNFAAPAGPELQPVTRIHLHSDLEGELRAGGNISYLYTLGSAAIIVLLLACINFTNLTTARAATRTKEVGIRKVMGAMRQQLIGQFFGEALLMSFSAFIIAIVLVNMTLPIFNQLAGKSVPPHIMTDPAMGVGLLVIMVLIGLAAGAYPALYLSRFRPVAVLKGSGNLRVSNLLVRKGLIVFQFTISTVFLIGIAVVMLQLNFLQTKDLGFDREHVLVLDGDNFPQIKDALQGIAGVERVSGVPRVLGNPLPMSPYKAEGVITDSLSQMRRYGVTPDFVETMGMRLVAGRAFIEGSPTDNETAFVLNESAVRELGWSPEEAVGRSFSMLVPPLEGGAEVWREGRVTGVVQDFHYEALYKTIGNVVLYPSYDLNLTFVRVRNVNPAVLDGIRSVWNRINPDAPFNYYFLDDRLRQQYAAEEKLGSFMGAATGMAILIACLGLFGLVAFSAGQRTKEIGIRKVLGATVGQIVALLSSDFLKLVCLAVILAVPIAYTAMTRWLDNFAYHIPLSWTIFVGAGVLALVIATLTVSFQSIKAAQADPAETIRYE